MTAKDTTFFIASLLAALLVGMPALGQCHSPPKMQTNGQGRQVETVPKPPPMPTPEPPKEIDTGIKKGPTTPSPETPKTPARGPRTPAGKRTPGPATPLPRGIAIPMTRQATSRAILRLDWKYPVPERRDSKRTSAARIALPRAKALAAIAGEDRRPLLVLRECTYCRGKDLAVLSRKLNNEKTLLLARWFRCVKLPPEVLRPQHPFRKLFDDKTPFHLFLCLPDGSARVRFDGRQPQSRLQAAMVRLITTAYEQKPHKALRAMLKHLSEFDKHDVREKTLTKTLRREKFGRRADKKKIARLERELAVVRKKRAAAMQVAKAVCDLKLKVDKTPGKKR